jgi:hypothetical protein
VGYFSKLLVDGYFRSSHRLVCRFLQVWLITARAEVKGHVQEIDYLGISLCGYSQVIFLENLANLLFASAISSGNDEALKCQNRKSVK